MSARPATLTDPSAPQRAHTARGALWFGLLAGPTAWFGQLCAGYALTSWPCFPQDQHLVTPLMGYEWTRPATTLISLIAVAVSIAAMLVARGLLRAASDDSARDPEHVLQESSGRTPFLALWGLIGGGAFAIATAFTGVALVILPRCAG